MRPFLVIVLLALLSSCTQYRVVTTQPLNTDCKVISKADTLGVKLTCSVPVTRSLVRSVKRLEGVNYAFKPKNTKYNIIVDITNEIFDPNIVMGNIRKVICVRQQN